MTRAVMVAEKRGAGVDYRANNPMLPSGSGTPARIWRCWNGLRPPPGKSPPKARQGPCP